MELFASEKRHKTLKKDLVTGSLNFEKYAKTHERNLSSCDQTNSISPSNHKNYSSLKINHQQKSSNASTLAASTEYEGSKQTNKLEDSLVVLQQPSSGQEEEEEKSVTESK